MRKRLTLRNVQDRGHSGLARVLTMLALLLTAATGAWAQEPATTYSVKMKDGTVDAKNWTIASGENSATGDAADGLTGLSKKDAVTLTYGGRLKVKSVTATTDAEPPAPVEGKFTINANGDQVIFAKGNLQATTTDLGATWTWGFAEHQYDYIGNAVANTSINGNGTVSANGTVDLFGWVGTSGNLTGIAAYGISNVGYETADAAYGYQTNDQLKHDWGELIGDGKTWRVLTAAEWNYITYSRKDEQGFDVDRYAKATVNGVPGLILFPDEYEHVATKPTNINDYGPAATFSDNQYDLAAWTMMENAGCIFLPASASRSKNVVSITTGYERGGYWTSTPHKTDGESSYHMRFDYRSVGSAITENSGRYYGNAVRLVKSATAAAPVVKPVTLTLGSMPNGGDPFSGSSGSGAYSQTFAVGGQIAIIYKNTSNESVKVVTDALTAADISNEGKTATINVSIDDADKTQGVTYIYPAAMANDDGTINCDFTNQDGTVTAIYSGSGAWDGDALPSATMESQQDIVKFTLQDNGGNALSASSLTISAASKKLVASKGFIIKSTTHSGYTYDGGTSSTYGEAPSNLVDGKKESSNHSKWCTSTGDKVNGIWYCEFHTASAVQVNGYTITTGNDNYSSNNRNPKDWVLKAKAKAGDSWTTIATVTNDATLKDEDCKSFDFNVDVHGTYQYFRFEVSATRGADVMQIEELELFKCNYGTAYGDLTVTPASATSVTFVALRNENASADTYTVSANVGGKKYGFSKSGVNFQNGKYYEITVKMTEQAASTVTWNFSEMSGRPNLNQGYTNNGVTLSGEGRLDFDRGTLDAIDGLTFTNTLGKHFKKIVITATGIANISGWTNGGEPGNFTSTWTGDASSVSFSGMTDRATSIVFTLE